MKKVLLTAMALLTIASASVFGMYGNNSDWIDFLVHGNQFRARMDQLGFVLGNDTIKGTFGFRANTGTMGSILTAATGQKNADDSTELDATISAGIGYTSDVFGIGVGYNYTWINKNLGVHTPVLMINALNDNLRIAVPIQIAVSDNLDKTGLATDRKDYLGVSTDIQLRYYTGIDVFNAIRFYVNYGQNSYKVGTEEYSASTLGFQLRLYFLNTTVGNVNINPYLRLEYRTALDSVGRDMTGDYANTVAYNAISSSSMTGYRKLNSGGADQNPFTVKIMPVLGIGANSDVVSLWVEPSIGYSVTGGAYKDLGLTHALAWGAYTELYITPVKDLEWYFEMDVNGNVGKKGDYVANNPASPVYFETTTGITWYLPSFGAAE